MRKSLIIAALACASLGYAQPANDNLPLAGRRYPVLYERQQMADGSQPPGRRSKSSGVYYSRPQGAYYVGFDLNGRGYYPSVLSVAPWHTITFVNSDDKKRGDWHMYAYNQRMEQAGEVEGFEEAVNADGDFEWSQNPGDFLYTPTLTLGEDSFAIGQANRYLRSTGRNYVGRIICDSLLTVVAADDHQAYEFHGSVYSNSVALGLFSDNMYGSGVANDRFVSYGAIQPFDRPMSPLYVEKVFAHGNSNSRQPIPEGDTLFCYVSRCTERVMSSGGGVKVPTYEITDTLYALASDTIGFYSTDVRGDKTIYTGSFIFNKHVVDEEGNAHPVPFVINPDDFDDNGFVFVFDGFDRPGMDAGIWGYRVNSDVDEPKLGLMLYRDNSTGDAYMNYYGDISMQVGMVCMYDAVIVVDEGGQNTVIVSADGQTCSLATSANGNDAEGVAVYTATSWYDDNGNALYTLQGLPEWVTGINIDDSMRRKAGTVGLNVVSFVCDPLPDGMSERNAEIYVSGRGVTSESPIIIHQINPDGIAVAKSKVNSPLQLLYNASGQRVGCNAKGLVIQKGKKIVR